MLSALLLFLNGEWVKEAQIKSFTHIFRHFYDKYSAWFRGKHQISKGGRGVRNISFPENVAYLLNKWLQSKLTIFTMIEVNEKHTRLSKISIFFWSFVFVLIESSSGLCYKSTAWNWCVFDIFLVRFFDYLDWILIFTL